MATNRRRSCFCAGLRGRAVSGTGLRCGSGDVECSFEALAPQIPARLNIGLSGIASWTTDIEGFNGGEVGSDYFRELIVRWFQFGTFCRLFRLHGFRRARGARWAWVAGSAERGLVVRRGRIRSDSGTA